MNLQKNIARINNWCSFNGIQLNVDKCATLTFTRSSNPEVFDYTVSNATIPRVSQFRDLGVLFDAQLSFASHIEAVSSSASKSLGFLFRTCKIFTDDGALKAVYYSLVRSKMEYASTVWYPHYHHHQLLLERIQKRFLKYLSFKCDGVYPPRGTDYGSLLQRHELESLSHRRDIASGKLLFKLVNNEIDSPSLLGQVRFTVPHYNSRSVDTFWMSQARTNLLLKAPLNHMSRNANCMYSDPFHRSLTR